MSHARRLSAVLLGITLFAGLALWQAEAQIQLRARVKPVPGGGDEAAGGEGSSALTLVKDPDAPLKMKTARQLIKEQEWQQVVRILQSMLDKPQDGFVEIDGKQVSVKAEANRLLGTMPPEGLQFYELNYGGAAKDRLASAKQRGDADLLADIATRYLHTEAGAEAAALLGTRCLNREEPLVASLYFDRLLSRKSADKLSPWTLYKATLSFYRAGNKEKGDELWKILVGRIQRAGGLELNKNTFANLEALRAELDRVASLEETQNVHDWPYYRGGPTRTEQAFGGTPFMEAAWSNSILPTKSDVKTWTEDNINHAVRYLSEQRGQPILPSFFPIAVNGKVVYRSYDGVYALSMKKEGKLEWYSYTEGGVMSLLADPNKRGYLDQWNQFYRQNGPHGVLFENSVAGALSTDGTRVLLVDDLAIPPHPYVLRNVGWGQAPSFGSLTGMVNRNSLKAYNLETGKLVWQFGGDPRFDQSNGEFQDSFFLGPPLPLGGKLYVLSEKNSELRLSCLEAKDTQEISRPPDIVWTQPLALTKEKIQHDINRRIHCAHLAYGNGILICPTNAGAILGVDLLSHGLVWAHSYRKGPINGNDPNQMMFQGGGRIWVNGMQVQANLNTEWRVSAPAIVEGHVVFTAPDATALHCIKLRDGTPVWEMPRAADDLYFAGVFHGKALVVGKNYVKALNLLKGDEAWRIDNVGMPSGQGAASDNIYFLPLKSGADKEPEVAAINIDTGRIVAHPKSRKKEVPGNLVFYNGEVLSQTRDTITSFPQLPKKLAIIDERIKANPNDPIGLIERGELRLDQGKLDGAYDDLHAALAHKPPEEFIPKAREKLYETLTEMLQRDFNLAEKHLDEYETLCKINVPQTAGEAERKKLEEEGRKRQANYLCLLAKGREKQGKLVEAFKAYMDFGALGDSKQLISVIDEPGTKSPPAVWARGRIAAMLDKATPEQRKPLEDKLAAEWAEIKDTKDITKLGQVVDVFGPSISVGRLARLQLAERLMEKATPPKDDDKPPDLDKEGRADLQRQAQVLFLQLHGQRHADPQTAAQAVDGLARLMLQKGQMSDAAFYYKQLGRDFPKIVVKEGKTGADLYNELTTDKRFLPFLEEPRPAWNGNFKVTEIFGNFPIAPTFSLEPAGDVPPFFQSHRLALDQNQQQLKVVNQLTGQEVWKTPALTALQYLQHGQPNIRTVYKVQGNVAVIHLGHMVYGIDAVDQKRLWQYNLYEPGTERTPQIGQVMRDRDGNLQLLYQDGWSQKLGQPGAVEASYVCLQNRNGLVTLDPIKGTAIWTKNDINSARTTVFGDDQYIYLVETNNDGAVSTANRAVRATDGVTIQVPEFGKAYQSKIAHLGRTLLVKNDTEKAVNLRLYDVLTGKDLWTKEFPAGSFTLKSELPELAGIVDPEGNVTAFDLRSRQEVLKAAVKKEHIDKLQDATILADRDQYYIVLNKTLDPNVNNGVWMNVFHGMRCLTVNGMVYAFEKGSGKMKWFNAVPNQMLVLEQFNDMPSLIFTSRSNEWLQQGLNRINQHAVKVKIIHKANGKLLWDKPLNPNTNNFHALVADPKAGTIDLIGFNVKIRQTLEPRDTKSSALPGTADTGVAVAQPAERLAPPVAQPLPIGKIKLVPAVPAQKE